ncbi:unnamed protein product [Prunus armeniaca]
MFGPLDRTQTHSLSPPAQPSSAATTPALMDHLLVGPGGSHAPASSTSSMVQPVSARRRHHPSSTTKTTSTDATGALWSQPAKKNTRGLCRQLKTAKIIGHNIGHVVRTHCRMQWKSWKVMPDKIKTETNYNLEDLDESLAYVNRLFAERYKQWKSDLHHNFQAFDDPQATLQEGCPNELEGGEDSPFSYKMDAQRRGGSKFPEIDVFGDFYVRPGNELVESLHTTMVERSQLVLQESASQLSPDTPLESVDPPQDAGFQILTKTLDQNLRRRPGTYCRGMGNARWREPRPRSSKVIALTAKVAELQGQMSMLLESLARSGIPISHFDPSSTSEPVQPKHGYQTSTPVENVQTSEPHLPNDQVDFGTLFD